MTTRACDNCLHAALRLDEGPCATCRGVVPINWQPKIEPSRIEKARALVRCPDAAMGEHACVDRTQCFEPCGDLGHDEAHVQAVAPVCVPLPVPRCPWDAWKSGRDLA